MLVDLNEDDLRELSVSFGHRKRLLKAIAALRAETDTEAPKSAPSSPSDLPAGERRQVTVLFCDMVGSTAMTAAADDPEDMFELIADYHAACSNVIESFGGYVARLVEATACWPILAIPRHWKARQSGRRALLSASERRCKNWAGNAGPNSPPASASIPA